MNSAFGGYASTERTTYFRLLAERLDRESLPLEVVVYATGAWKSSQELRALKLHGIGVKPDLVLFLDGLNDLTNGSNAHTLYGVQTRTLDGSRWQPLYNEGDFEERVRVYLAEAFERTSNRRAAEAERAAARNAMVAEGVGMMLPR